MMKYRVVNFPMHTKPKMVSKRPVAVPLITPEMLKKEKEALQTHQPESVTKEKFMHSIEAWKERIKARKNGMVKHTEATKISKEEDAPAPPYSPPPPYAAPPPYSHHPENENPKVEKPIVLRFDPKVIRGTLAKLRRGKNLEQLLETHGIRQGVDISTLKDQLDVLLKDTEEKAADENIAAEEPAEEKLIEPKVKPITKDLNSNKWEKQMAQLKDLNQSDNLEKWLESLDVPHNVSAPHIKAKLKKHFMHETFETLQGRSVVYEEDSRAKKLWDEFKDMNPAKQVAIVVGITAITAIVGFFTWELYLLAFPNALAINPFFVEVGAQIFIQRQEGAFHLLVDQTERTKPLSTAWANQYVLWKYI